MRYFVNCRHHPEEKIYLNLVGSPAKRSDIPYEAFSAACPTSGRLAAYSTSEIVSEPGTSLPLLGTAVGALLFAFTPLAGLIGSVAGLFGGAERERKRVEEFNSS